MPRELLSYRIAEVGDHRCTVIDGVTDLRWRRSRVTDGDARTLRYDAGDERPRSFPFG